MADATNAYIGDSTFPKGTQDELAHAGPVDESDASGGDDGDEEMGSGMPRLLRTGAQVAFVRPAADVIVPAAPAPSGPGASQEEVLSQPLMRFLTSMAGAAGSTLDWFLRRKLPRGGDEALKLRDSIKETREDIAEIVPDAAYGEMHPIDEDVAVASAVCVVVVQAMVHSARREDFAAAFQEFAIRWPESPGGLAISDAYARIVAALGVAEFPALQLRHAGFLIPEPRALQEALTKRAAPVSAGTHAPWPVLRLQIANLISFDRQLAQFAVPAALGETERLAEPVTAAIDQAFSRIGDSGAGSSSPAARVGKEALMRSDATYAEFAALCACVYQKNTAVINQTHYTNMKVGDVLDKEIRRLVNAFKYKLQPGPPIRWQR